METVVLGSTGLCGAAFLHAACRSDLFGKLWAFSRRELPEEPKLQTIVNKDSSQWIARFPKVDVVYSGLATPVRAAGGFQKQFKVDHDLNIELAQAAKKAGCKTYVLVSSGGANADSFYPYFKMKGQIEDDILKIGFCKVVFLQPGLLLGERQHAEGGFKTFGDGLLQKIGVVLYKTPLQFLVGTPVYDSQIAAAALWAVQKLPNGTHYICSKQIQEFPRD